MPDRGMTDRPDGVRINMRRVKEEITARIGAGDELGTPTITKPLEWLQVQDGDGFRSDALTATTADIKLSD
jgi:hypothetical protein